MRWERRRRGEDARAPDLPFAKHASQTAWRSETLLCASMCWILPTITAASGVTSSTLDASDDGFPRLRRRPGARRRAPADRAPPRRRAAASRLLRRDAWLAQQGPVAALAGVHRPRDDLNSRLRISYCPRSRSFRFLPRLQQRLAARAVSFAGLAPVKRRFRDVRSAGTVAAGHAPCLLVSRVRALTFGATCIVHEVGRAGGSPSAAVPAGSDAGSDDRAGSARFRIGRCGNRLRRCRRHPRIPFSRSSSRGGRPASDA